MLLRLQRGTALRGGPMAFFLLVPPHGLKKMGTLPARHWSRISVTRSRFIGRDFGRN